MAPNNDSTVTPQNTPAPTAAAPPDVDNSGISTTPAPVATTLTPPQPAPVVNPNPASVVAPAPGAAPKPNMLKGMAEGLFNFMRGTTNDYKQTPNGPVAVPRKRTPGEFARAILGSALSLAAAGAGGIEAERQGRPYEQNPNTSVGAVIKGPEMQRKQQAQQEFENSQNADRMTLLKHQDAREQLRSAQDVIKAEDDHQAAVQARIMGSRDLDNNAYDQMVKQQKNYQMALAMPGAQVMKDTNGQELNFLDPREAQAYALKHPEILHGSTDGSSKFGTVIVKNPATGQYQVVDYPADRHQYTIVDGGAKKDADGNTLHDKDGAPIPDGSVIDPVTKKPTVITEKVTPDQYRAIVSKNLSDTNVSAQMEDREAQAQKYLSDARKNDELNDAIDLFDSGELNKMTARQKQVMGRFLFQQETLMSSRENQANQSLQKVLAAHGGDATDPDVKAAQKEYNDAKDAYDNARENWQQVTGNTDGIILANQLINTSGANPDWNKIDATISGSGLPADEQEKAKARVWNHLTPAQRAAIEGKQQNKTAATKAPAAATAFDVAKWKKANPTGDANAAIAAAKAQGLTVVNQPE